LWTRVPQNAGKCLSSCTTGGFSRRAQLHEWVSEWLSSTDDCLWPKPLLNVVSPWRGQRSLGSSVSYLYMEGQGHDFQPGTLKAMQPRRPHSCLWFIKRHLSSLSWSDLWKPRQTSFVRFESSISRIRVIKFNVSAKFPWWCS
jgi:hypothetical protein